ncbi:hypothetical protein D3C81_1980220 [compost metagenome]
MTVSPIAFHSMSSVQCCRNPSISNTEIAAFAASRVALFALVIGGVRSAVMLRT